MTKVGIGEDNQPQHRTEGFMFKTAITDMFGIKYPIHLWGHDAAL